MSRDLLDFSIALSHGIDRATQVYEKTLDRQLNQSRYQAAIETARQRNAIQDARMTEWSKTQADYRKYLQAKTAKTAGAGAAGGGAATVNPALAAEISRASTQGYTPMPQPAAPNIVVNTESDAPPPGGPPLDMGDNTPAIPAGANYRRGGVVKKPPADAGTSGPGGGFGARAAPPTGYVPGMKKGGIVKFEGGGDTRRWWDAVGGPDEHSANQRVDVGAERTKQEPSPVLDKVRKNVGELKDFFDWMSTGPAGKAISKMQRGSHPAERTGEEGGGADEAGRRAAPFAGETARANESSSGAGDTSQAFSTEPPPVAGQGQQPPEGWDAGGAGRPSASARGGGGAATGARRGVLRDPNRTAAFDPTLDANDPDNVHAVDTSGRVNPVQGPVQTGTPAQGGGLPASGMTGGPGEGTTLSTNNAAHDMALQGGNNYGEFMFHQHQADYHTQAGKHALLAGHGAATPAEVQSVFKALGLPDGMPLDQKMLAAVTAAHQYGIKQNAPEKGDKMAFELMQFGNVMAKQHGSQAVQAMQNGDIGQAAHQILAGYNWLPNGTTANVDPSGKNFVLTGKDGKPVATYPMTPENVKNFALGMASGELNWDVMRGRSQAQPAPQGPPQGGGGGGGGLPPQVTPPQSAIQTQPPAVPAAGPASTAVASQSVPPSPQTGGAPQPQPPPQAPPPQAVQTAPAAAGTNMQPLMKDAGPADPYEMPNRLHQVTTVKPVDYKELQQYEDPTFQEDMARYMKGLSQTQGGKGGQREAATWNHLMSWRSSKHAEMMKARSARQNELDRQQRDLLKTEQEALKEHRDRTGEEGNINTAITDQLKVHEADPYLKQNSALSWMDTDAKKSDLVQAAHNIYKDNGHLSAAQATKLAVRMTDIGEGDHLSFKPLGGTAKKNVVGVRVKEKGIDHDIVMPKETYNQLVDIHKETVERAAKAKQDKIKAAKENAKQAITGTEIGRQLNKLPQMDETAGAGLM